MNKTQVGVPPQNTAEGKLICRHQRIKRGNSCKKQYFFKARKGEMRHSSEKGMP